MASTLLVAREEARFDMSRHAAASLLAIAWFACIPLACGGSSPLAPFDGAGDASADAPARDADIVPDGADAETDAGPSRPFALAATGAQLLITGPALGLQLTLANLADDVDVVAVHFEFWGVPWDAFEANAAPPSAWVSLVDGLAAGARSAGKPVFLSVNMIDGGRRSFAPQTTVVDGKLGTRGSSGCADFATADGQSKKAAYQRYVAYLIDKFAPTFINVGVELNLFFENCPAQRGAIVDVVNAAYDAAKAAKPDVVAFPSFQLEHLYGYAGEGCAQKGTDLGRAACFDANYAQLGGIKRDRFAMSSYPFGSFVGVAQLPGDWFPRGAARAGERPLIAETGWLSTGLALRAKTGCITPFTYVEADTAAYLERVLSAAAAAKMDLVTWWSDRDLIVNALMTDCPCAFDATWCTVLDAFRGASDAGDAGDPQLAGELALKAFGTMGLRSYDGTPKPATFARWQAARALRFQP